MKGENAEYVRQLEDACLEVWAHVPPDEVLSMERDQPDLVRFMKELSDRWWGAHNDGSPDGQDV